MKVDINGANVIAAAMLSASLVLIAGDLRPAPKVTEKYREMVVLVPSRDRDRLVEESHPPDRDDANSNPDRQDDSDRGEIDPGDDGPPPWADPDRLTPI
jgi:hypothetical protein